MHQSIEGNFIRCQALYNLVPKRSASIGLDKEAHIALVRLKLEFTVQGPAAFGLVAWSRLDYNITGHQPYEPLIKCMITV